MCLKPKRAVIICARFQNELVEPGAKQHPGHICSTIPSRASIQTIDFCQRHYRVIV